LNSLVATKPFAASSPAVTPFDPMKAWFLSLQETGEFIGIRFGRIPPGKTEPEWIFLPHTDVDGIGGFAQMFRDKGVDLPLLPQNKHPSPPSRLGLVRNLPKMLLPRRKLTWRALNSKVEKPFHTDPPAAVAWHVFDEETTTNIRRVTRSAAITVNSFLLKHLAKAIRGFLEDPSATIPWMIPVNLRGKVNRDADIENHTSYVSVGVHPYDSLYDVHRKIYKALERGDHWANWFSYDSARILGAGPRKYLIRIERCMAEWNIGSFSNLGDWDSENKVTHPDLAGTWLFAPPSLRVQPLGCGCVTFQNRLALVIQAHPELTTDPAAPRAWMQAWIKEIQTDLASHLRAAPQNA
jgi:hypothetical protein